MIEFIDILNSNFQSLSLRLFWNSLSLPKAIREAWEAWEVWEVLKEMFGNHQSNQSDQNIHRQSTHPSDEKDAPK
ncbi:hypothetical protein RO3G_00391 [Rhizopus delemar RA 99-880]|uniref:Uncharacterized protein n=1 Tax=Rhizopus delemar (strain RA 99-880 / ATCC MYA-4621 / FGSC 9543 / NRRL 43880) TaxID=246409 RepID=I1BHK7_RHIO9|nr:hypothetical protein RO3G_00391 [Rhizopus delemar RA 99-880]|eukprot:EIE75687.1 hypothetical protein RO3G_00391 [Rhizopus delemar RA 99-880]